MENVQNDCDIALTLQLLPVESTGWKTNKLFERRKIFFLPRKTICHFTQKSNTQQRTTDPPSSSLFDRPKNNSVILFV